MITQHFDSLPSTNDAAKELASRHPDESVLVTAAEQTAGRGRLGRSWVSPRGGLWMTLALRERMPSDTARAPLAAGAAIAHGIAAALVDHDPLRAEDIRIKWPNDVLLAGRKVAGVLCERLSSDGAPALILIGIGVNADFDESLVADQARIPAITLRSALGRSIQPDDLAGPIAADLERRMLEPSEAGGALPSGLIDAVNERLAYRGEAVSFVHAGQEARGTLDGVDAAGRLRVHAGGAIHTLNSGEVDHVTPDSDSHDVPESNGADR